MKKFITPLLLLTIILIARQEISAQAWTKDTKVLAPALGGSSYVYFYPNNYYGGYYGNYKGRAAFFGRGAYTGGLFLQGEFGIHDYVGIGFTTGLGGKAGNGNYYYTVPEMNFPIGFIANFHFYQLIADKTGKNIHADKLDIYAGMNAGSGFAVQYWDSRSHIVPIGFFGLQGGIRYYFVPKVGVNAELGFGKSFALAGFVFKL